MVSETRARGNLRIRVRGHWESDGSVGSDRSDAAGGCAANFAVSFSSTSIGRGVATYRGSAVRVADSRERQASIPVSPSISRKLKWRAARPTATVRSPKRSMFSSGMRLVRTTPDLGRGLCRRHRRRSEQSWFPRILQRAFDSLSPAFLDMISPHLVAAGAERLIANLEQRDSVTWALPQPCSQAREQGGAQGG
jgi:hypothetical protein